MEQSINFRAEDILREINNRNRSKTMGNSYLRGVCSPGMKILLITTDFLPLSDLYLWKLNDENPSQFSKVES